MFALLALAGDLGCSGGPLLVTLVSSGAGELRAGLFAAMIFPAGLIIGIIILIRSLNRSAAH